MLRHGIIALFLIALALPAMAMSGPVVDDQVALGACHDMPIPQDDGSHDKKDMRLHGCIGCIAPLSHIMVMQSDISSGYRPYPLPTQSLAGAVPPPNLPPPRC